MALKYNTLNALFTAIANSLRGKTGSTSAIVADDFPSVIDGISVGITPSGTINITANGTHNVTNYASAVVNVAAEEPVSVVIPITLSSALGAGANINYTLLSAHDFVKKHYAKDGFTVVWLPLSNTTTAAAANVAGPVLHTNRVLITTKSGYYGIMMRSSGPTAGAVGQVITAKVNGTGYNVSFRADSSGNLKLYVASTFTVPAGNYLLILTCAE